MTRVWAILAGGATLVPLLAGSYYLVNIPVNGERSALGNAEVYPVRFPLPPVGAKAQPTESPTESAPSDAATTQGDEAIPEAPPEEVAPSPAPRASVRRADGPIIPVEFDLRTMAHRDGAAEPDGTVSVRKRLLHNGKELGLLELRVDPLGTIAVDTADLVELLSPVDKSLADAVAGSGQDRTTFKALRQRGITVNYDPIHDTVLMQDR